MSSKKQMPRAEEMHKKLTGKTFSVKEKVEEASKGKKSLPIVLQIWLPLRRDGTSQVLIMVKSPPANSGDLRDEGSIPGSGRSPGGRHGNPFRYACLENPLDWRAWQATVHRAIQSQNDWSSLAQHTSRDGRRACWIGSVLTVTQL